MMEILSEHPRGKTLKKSTPRSDGKTKRQNASSVRAALDKGGQGDSVRLQLTLKPEYAVRLEQLRLNTESPSYAEVLRDAIRVYETLVNEIQKGNRIVIREQDGTMIAVNMHIKQ